MLGFKVLKCGSNKYKAHDVFLLEKNPKRNRLRFGFFQ